MRSHEHDTWSDQLSAYLDEDLSPAERIALETHLSECADCRRLLVELREVVRRAAALRDTAPGTDLWAGIVARLDAPEATAPARALAPARPPATDAARALAAVAVHGAGRHVRGAGGRRVSFTLPQLAAAGVALALLSGGAVWGALRGGPRSVAPPLGVEVAAPDPAAFLAAASFGGEGYDITVAQLEDVLFEARGRLDPATVTVLEESLASIEQAIEEARAALAEDPASAYLNHHLAVSMRRKLDLLRRATAIIQAQS